MSLLYGSTGAHQNWRAGIHPGRCALKVDDQFGAQLATGDFNDNDSADLAAAAPAQDVGSIFDVGAVSALDGAG